MYVFAKLGEILMGFGLDFMIGILIDSSST